MKTIRDSARLAIRIMSLNLFAMPIAFMGVMVISFVWVSFVAVFPPKDTRLLGAAIGIFSLLVIGPGLLTGALILCNELAEDKRIAKRALLRAALWGGGLVLLAGIGNQLRIPPPAVVGSFFWLAPALVLAFLAELIKWP